MQDWVSRIGDIMALLVLAAAYARQQSRIRVSTTPVTDVHCLLATIEAKDPFNYHRAMMSTATCDECATVRIIHGLQQHVQQHHLHKICGLRDGAIWQGQNAVPNYSSLIPYLWTF